MKNTSHSTNISNTEIDFFIKSAKALGWYRQNKNRADRYTLKQIGTSISLTESAVSKYLISPRDADCFNTLTDLNKKSKTLLTLQYALQIAEAMDSSLWEILYLYTEHTTDSSKSTKLNENFHLKDIANANTSTSEHMLTDVNNPKFQPWLGDFYCYFSSTSSSEIDKEKQENSRNLNDLEQELFDITPSKDHLFCGMLKIFKSTDNLCHVSLTFMSDKKTHQIKHYHGSLSLSQQYSAGFISLYCEENGEGSYIIVKSPDSPKLTCRMAMALTLSSIDGHRRACSEKMLITKEYIPENSTAYRALKAFLPMNDSVIRITDKDYTSILEELINSNSAELNKFAEDYPSLSFLASSNSTIETCECALIPESTINNWKYLNSSSRDMLRLLMREHSIANWYYKANNKNAEEILYILENKKV